MQAFADKNVKRKVPAGKTEITVKCITKINNSLNPDKKKVLVMRFCGSLAVASALILSTALQSLTFLCVLQRFPQI